MIIFIGLEAYFYLSLKISFIKNEISIYIFLSLKISFNKKDKYIHFLNLILKL
jgi:hypothetical protein